MMDTLVIKWKQNVYIKCDQGVIAKIIITQKLFKTLLGMKYRFEIEASPYQLFYKSESVWEILNPSCVRVVPFENPHNFFWKYQIP